jgi:hypothetical protein
MFNSYSAKPEIYVERELLFMNGKCISHLLAPVVINLLANVLQSAWYSAESVAGRTVVLWYFGKDGCMGRD